VGMMEVIKNFLKDINLNDFKNRLIISVVFIIVIVTIFSISFTQARYETDTTVRLSPDLAFFIADVQSETGQIRLDGMVPSATPYLYTFNVSNYYKQKKANVDLKYKIEIITTTNMPLRYKVYHGDDMTTNIVSSQYYDTDSNGVYYQHLVIDSEYILHYQNKETDQFTLYVEYPLEFKNNYKEYAGIIDLVDIKVNAEQVV
jgi:hypothetical protein